MGNDSNDSAQVITIVGTLDGVSRGSRRDVIEKSLDVTHVRENFARFLDALKAIVDVHPPSVGVFELDEVQFGAEISANGEFKLLGTGGGVEAKSAVTFTLRRKEQSDKPSRS